METQIETMRELFALENQLKEREGVNDETDAQIAQLHHNVITFINLCIGGQGVLARVGLNKLKNQITQIDEPAYIDE